MFPVNRYIFNRCLLLGALLIGAAALYGQKPTETYQGRPAIAQQVLVKLRVPNAAAVQTIQQILHADSVHQVGGAFGPHVFHSRDLSLPVQLALLAGRSEIASLEPD